MARILIITDQPLYKTSETKLAGDSICVETVFSGDIADGKFETAYRLLGKRYDTVLHPATVTKDTPGGDKVFEFIKRITDDTPNTRISVYANQH